MGKFMCWEDDESEGYAVEIDNAVDAEDAATDACEQWHSHGRWAGGEMASAIVVHVRDEAGALTVVDVRPEYEVSFYGYARGER
jgi:hypothetical protein